MKLTREEREKYINNAGGIDCGCGNRICLKNIHEYWLSKIDTILEERVHEIMEYIDSRAGEIDTVQDWEKIKLDILNKSTLK